MSADGCQSRHLGLTEHVPLFTRDIDVAVPRILTRRERTVDEILKAAGLQDSFKNQLRSPAVSYVGRLGGTDVEVEFITNEPGNREGTRVVQPGLNAAGLHYVDLLMENAFVLEVEVGGADIAVRVPSPGSFILQKALVFPQRSKPEKRAKDLYYIFDVWDGCREWREWIVAEIRGGREFRKTWTKRALGNLDRFCEQPIIEGIAMLVEQRPATAFPELSDDQFAQYTWGEMASLRDALRG